MVPSGGLPLIDRDRGAYPTGSTLPITATVGL
jgi:hypothetical protein